MKILTRITEMNKKLAEHDYLEIYGARENNLKNIDLRIPRDKLVVITGLSGSGKSSLAFETIYAEGQRRYMESFSAYARQFIGNMERPDVDEITGLSPVISIEQKSVNRNPRSTVGTITEIYDFMRLLFARTAEPFSYNTGEKMVRYSEEHITKMIMENYSSKKINILAPVIRGRKGHYRELFEQIRQQGFAKVRIDGELKDLVYGMQLDRYKTHDIEIVIDRLIVSNDYKSRLTQSIETAFRRGKGMLMVLEDGSTDVRYFSKLLMCPTTGIAYQDPEPNTFSFNSPYGACPKCNGLGTIVTIDINKIIPDKECTIRKGGIAPLGEYKNNWVFSQLEVIGSRYGFDLDTPIAQIPDNALDIILYGSSESFTVTKEIYGTKSTYSMPFEGIINVIKKQCDENAPASILKWANSFMNETDCPECHGQRLKKEALHFRLNGKNIAEVSNMDIISLSKWIDDLPNHLDNKQLEIAHDILIEIKKRINFLINVGIDYLNLNRPAKSLSGGEAQRIRLATQIGSQLTGILYILDEPSIGLHQRDNRKLINSLKELRDIGNSIIVVEHDKDTMLASDHIIDIGPGAGINGGEVVFQGSPDELSRGHGLTCDYLNGIRKIQIPKTRRKPLKNNYLRLYNASGHNLKNVNLDIPLGLMVCVTGVSGSGKSSLVNETLYPILSRHFYRSEKQPLPYEKIEGLELIDKVIEIDQAPIGKTPRSNPATYTKVFDDIRKLFGELPESKIRGYKAGRFSFNVRGGRCESCQGGGVRVIEMNFLPDVQVLCEACQGKRYNRETLEVRFKGKSINDVLNLTVDEAVSFFENMPQILQKIKTLQDVGLGYITLGQPSTTLSGGEAQRVKLATELAKRDTGNTLYILDEPTTGLHFEDIKVLMDVLNKLVDKGNTVLIIEHNLDVIKMADYIIDMGPEGGSRGGMILCQGSPEEVAEQNIGYTAHFIKEELNNL
ncbi:MAG: excinuclease ABC subunit UvrA [Bacteroidales bacterium]|nr:excinuclease ABC subunit UvrA [Bacteroidales bacterium]MDD5978665.1 excinuclease ABC subunit UvrA [Bacteroidales bacterium]